MSTDYLNVETTKSQRANWSGPETPARGEVPLRRPRDGRGNRKRGDGPNPDGANGAYAETKPAPPRDPDQRTSSRSQPTQPSGIAWATSPPADRSTSPPADRSTSPPADRSTDSPRARPSSRPAEITPIPQSSPNQPRAGGRGGAIRQLLGPMTGGLRLGASREETVAEQRLKVDWPNCKAHGLCAEIAPELIQLDEWGFPMFSREAIQPEDHATARKAVHVCPTLALHLIDVPRRG